MREFKFFVGYVDSPFMEIDWDLINRLNNITTVDWNQPFHTYNPTWVVNPGLIQYTPPNYTITTTPSYGTSTIPYNGTVNTATGFNLTTSNPNGTTYTTTGTIGTLTTGTAFYSSSSFK